MNNHSALEIFIKTAKAFIRKALGLYGGRPNRYDQIFQTIENLEAKQLMEIGTYRGKRGLQMIEAALKKHNPSDISYTGFDLFEPMDEKQYAYEISKQPLPEVAIKERLEKTGARITLIKGNTLQSMPEAVPTLPKMDVIFIDGGHSYETIKNDWEWSEKLMHDKTAVIFDDYWLNRKDGSKPIVDAIDRNKFTVEILPILDIFYNPNWGKLELTLAKVTRK
jgi:predicted O-methyltransferase YrrM